MSDLQLEFLRALPHGVEYTANLYGTQFFLGFQTGPSDFDLLPELYPESRFKTGQFHVAQLDASCAFAEEILSIVELTEDQDTVLFFCNTQDTLEKALAALNNRS